MVDLALLQSVSYIAGALGVCVAAFYYVMTLRTQQENLKETMKNRRAIFSNNILSTFLSENGMLDWMDLANMQWSDWDDYKKKYDSSVNRENFGKRIAFFNTCQAIGYQYMSGAVDLETIYHVCGQYIIASWAKFKPIVEGYRNWEWSKNAYADWEYLTGELERLHLERDSGYRGKMETMFEVERKAHT